MYAPPRVDDSATARRRLSLPVTSRPRSVPAVNPGARS